MGCAPFDDVSRIANLRWPKPTLLSKKNPSPSGPRWAIAFVISVKTFSATFFPSRLYIPVIPHILFFFSPLNKFFHSFFQICFPYIAKLFLCHLGGTYSVCNES